MNKILAISSLLRLNNLCIIVITQSIFTYLFLLPALEAAGFTAVLGGVDLICFLAITPLIAAGGNIINDILDVQNDRLNQKHRPWTNFLTTDDLTRMYWSVNFVALSLGMYLAATHQRWLSLVLIPGGIGSLWFYSYTLKNRAFIGNALISLFCGGVVWVLFLPDIDAWGLMFALGEPSRTAWLVALFGLFASLANFLREWSKDLEDLPGDRAGGGRTLAVILPERSSARIIQLILSVWFVLNIIGLFNLPFSFNRTEWWTSLILLEVPILYFIYQIEQVNRGTTWGDIHLGLKIYMGIGLLLACIIKMV